MIVYISQPAPTADEKFVLSKLKLIITKKY